MGEWKKVRIGEFLTERQGRYKPNDNAIATYKRLDKIDFSGTAHISEKPSKTDMIVVQPGDLVISGINVAKGAIAVYQGTEPVTATIHYSSYIFDDSVIDLEYFKYFVKSPAFIETLKKQVKSGIKTEIKPKVFLPLEISLPDLPTQKQIVKRISVNLKRVNKLAKEIETQKRYAKQLRRNILQDAIEGKLTADWRKEHPVQKGNPDYDAEALFESIQKGRKVDKKRKALPPILDAEKPFELPTGWKWVRLKQISEIGTGATPLTSEKRYYENGTIPWITSSSTGNDFIIEADDFITTEALDETNCNVNPVGTLIVAMYGQGKTRGQIAELCIEAATNQACATIQVPDTQDNILRSFIKLVFKKMYHEIRQLAQGGIQPNLNLSKIANTVFCIPPLAEQQEIVETVSDTLDTILKIEKQIQERRILSERLISGIIRGNLEEKENC